MYHLTEKRIDLPEPILAGLQAMGKEFDLNRIILFGSRARCTNGERSDMDLALYVKDTKQYYNILDYTEEMETLLMFDIVDLNGSAVSGDLLDEIRRDGVILYEKV